MVFIVINRRNVIAGIALVDKLRNLSRLYESA